MDSCWAQSAKLKYINNPNTEKSYKTVEVHQTYVISLHSAFSEKYNPASKKPLLNTVTNSSGGAKDST
jgi:hypothetical protein